VCYFLYVASPLTLSEVRSMLPDGLIADALPVSEQQRLKNLHYDAAIAARILHGNCACDLIRDRLPDPRDDEAYHRQRYRQLGYDRNQMIQYLEHHRRSTEGRPPRPRPPGYWGHAFNAFVIEHARNAGPTLYYRHFSHDGLAGDSGLDHPIRHVRVGDIGGLIDEWLPDSTPVMVA